MLDSYQEGQVLYGRDEEISSITECIEYNVQTFLYGKSGIGKTSLIQAGIFPRLREAHFFPVVIRLAFYGNEPLREVVKRLVEEEAESENALINKQVLSHSPIDDTDLTEAHLIDYFSKTKFEDENGTAFIPVLVFDQFEETINNEDNWQRTVDFLNDELYDLMDNSTAIQGNSLPYTNYRVVFSMREDYLYCLEDIVDRYGLWELRDNRFRIKALTDDKAAEVIRCTCGNDGLEKGKEDKIINAIIKISRNNTKSRFNEINTALLSLVCSLLSDNSSDNCIVYSDLKNIQTYLYLYYEEICSTIGSKATKYLENNLLTNDGRRSSIDELEAINSNKITKDQLDYLVEKKLLRRIKTDNTSTRYEYIHDLFAKMIHKRVIANRNSWYKPDFSGISKRMDLSAFIKRFLITVTIIALAEYIYLFFHSLIRHQTFNVFKTIDLYVCSNIFFYFSFVVITLYISPLIVKRLHDVNKTGWYLLIIPSSLILINAPNLFVHLNSVLVVSLCKSIGIILLLSLIYIVFSRSTLSTNRKKGMSVLYEKVVTKQPIDHVVFRQLIMVELLFLLSSITIVDMIYMASTNFDVWRIFYIKVPLWIHVLFPNKLPSQALAILSLFPFVIMFSPTFKSRVNGLGYKQSVVYLPYFNVLLFFECFLSNKFLKSIKLVNDKQKHNSTEDEVYLNIENKELFDERISDNSPLKELFMIFMPFAAPFYMFNKKYSLKARYRAGRLFSVNFAIFYLIISFVLALSLQNGSSWKTTYVLLQYYPYYILLFIILMIIHHRKITKEVIAILDDNKCASAKQLSKTLGLKKKYIVRIMRARRKSSKMV